jgi:hypothetical protein
MRSVSLSRPRSTPFILLFALTLSVVSPALIAEPAASRDTADATVERAIGNLTVAIDPKTGRLRAPNAAEVAQLQQELKRMFTKNVISVSINKSGTGLMSAQLGEGFENVSIMRLASDGSLVHACVSDAEAASQSVVAPVEVAVETK